MIELPNVTLLGMDGRQEISQSMKNLHKAFDISSRNINFGSIRYLGVEPFGLVSSSVEFCEIDPVTSWGDWNDFMLFELTNYVTTDYVIIIHDDGFILNSNLWTDEFLKYDYIGAPFSYDLHLGPQAPLYIGEESYERIHDSVKRKKREDVNVVGNGGFSFRSKKFLDATASSPYDNNGGPEDLYACVNYYDYFSSRGITYAPEDLAMRFSLNIDMYRDPLEASRFAFGFHGYKKMVELL